VREELPAAAQARIAGIRSSGTWGSSLTSGEFAALRSAGFEPVGQVFGAAVSLSIMPLGAQRRPPERL
jgi:hypothetical protein